MLHSPWTTSCHFAADDADTGALRAQEVVCEEAVYNVLTSA